MKKVFIVHGFEGVPNGCWRPWLMSELKKKDVYACALAMPSPDTPRLTEWLEELSRHIDRNEHHEVYLVGHSLGGAVIMRYFEKHKPAQVKGVVLVSAPCATTTNHHLDDFLHEEFDFAVIKKNMPTVAVIHGDDDPVVPFTDAERIAQELGGKLIPIPHGKHLNGSAGFIMLQECLEVLMGMILNDQKLN